MDYYKVEEVLSGRTAVETFRGGFRVYRTDTGFESWHNTEGRLHRDNGPAVSLEHEFLDPHVEYNQDNPTMIMGYRKEWYQDGVMHREGGPAWTQPGIEEWWQNGKTHRDDGPAVIRTSKSFPQEIWWWKGQRQQNQAEWKTSKEMTEQELLLKMLAKLKN